MNLTLKEIFQYLDATPSSRCINEGECLVNSSHIITCGKLIETSEEIQIFALCLQTSALNNLPHEIKGTYNVLEGRLTVKCMTCTCKAGSGGRCKHVAGVLIYCTRVSTDSLEKLSSTDVKCVWSQRKHAISKKYKPVPLLETECFKAKVPVILEQDEEEIRKNLNIIKEYAPSNSAFVIFNNSTDTPKPESENIASLLMDNLFENSRNGEMMTFLYNSHFPAMEPCCVETYNNLIVPVGTVKSIFIKTIENEQFWKQCRQFRITGSRCYGLYTYKGDDWSSKTMKYFWPKKFSNKYVEYGIEQEKNARETYENCFNVKLYKLGLFIPPPHPWLGYSADGVVFKENYPDKLIEFKCPFLGKEKTITEVLKDCKFLKEVNGVYQLREKHTYYAQVQFGMSLLNLKSCDFVVFSSFDKSMYIINIQHNVDFSKNLLGSIKTIYFSQMLHFICENKEYIK